MEYRPLHITLISAEGLKDVNMFSKMDVYAEVSIAGYPQSKKKTRVDKNCGTNPKWNERLEFIVDEPFLTKPGHSLLFLLKAEGTVGSDKDVGSATVPLHDLYNPDHKDGKVVEYQLHTPSGKPKGSLKFSYGFGEKFTQEETKQPAPPPPVAYPGAGHSYPPAYPPPGMGYPNQYAPPYPNQYAPPPQAGYGYPGASSGYGGYQQPPPPYGYAQQPQKPKKGGMGGAGLGLGLGAGLLGGLLVGEMVSDIGDAGAYADGYDDAMGDMGGDF